MATHNGNRRDKRAQGARAHAVIQGLEDQQGRKLNAGQEAPDHRRRWQRTLPAPAGNPEEMGATRDRSSKRKQLGRPHGQPGPYSSPR